MMLEVTQRSDKNVSQLDPLRNVPAKFELLAANGCGDIAWTSTMDRWTDGQTHKMVKTIPPQPSWLRGNNISHVEIKSYNTRVLHE